MKRAARSMTKRLARCDGFVLPAAMFALVILSFLAVVAVGTAGDEQRSSRALRESGWALYAVEAGVNRIWSTVEDSVATNLAPGDSADFGWQTLANGAAYHGVLHRFDDGGTRMYGLTVVGRGQGPLGGQRVVNLSLTSGVDVYDFATAAVKTKGQMEAVDDPASTIDGNDANPSGWSCDTSGPSMPGIVVQDSASFSQGSGTILGNPPVAVDSTINASSFTQFGDVTYADLVALADHSYPGDAEISSLGPVVSGGQCDTGVISNWGAPLNPSSKCGGYFPITHVAGDVEIESSNSAGQGILLVDGNLEMEGDNFAFYGLIIVQGSCKLEDASAVYGAVLCANQGADEQEIEDSASLNFSTCTVHKALEAAGIGASLRPLTSRAWSEFLN